VVVEKSFPKVRQYRSKSVCQQSIRTG